MLGVEDPPEGSPDTGESTGAVGPPGAAGVIIAGADGAPVGVCGGESLPSPSHAVRS